MKERTIISLERSQLRALKARARAQGISVAEFMRRLVSEYLSDEHPIAPVPRAAFEQIVGIGSSGRRDVGDRHDALVGEAIRQDHDR